MTLLVDTRVGTLALRRSVSVAPAVLLLKHALRGAEVVVTTGMVLQDLLQGFSGPTAKAEIIQRFATLPLVQPDRNDHVEAAEIRNGFQPCAGYNRLTRLTSDDRQDIAAAAKAVLPPGTRVLLFGSRVDDLRRGGDVDLLVETPTHQPPDEVVRLRSLFTAQLYRRMGERRIDVLVCARDQTDGRAVVAAARRDGVEFTRT